MKSSSTLLVASICVVIVAVCTSPQCHADDKKKQLAPLESEQCVRIPGVSVPVYIANPRDAGELHLVATDGVVIAGPDAVGEHPPRKSYSYSVFAGRIIQMEDDSFKIPDMIIRVPYSIADGTYAAIQEPIDHHSSTNRWWLPYGKKFKQLYLVLWGRDEETGWRIFEVPLDYTERIVPSIDIPDLMTLPRLEAHPHGKKMWSGLVEAQQTYEKRRYGSEFEHKKQGNLRLLAAPHFP